MISITPLTEELCKKASKLEKKYLTTGNSEAQLLEIAKDKNYGYFTVVDNNEIIGIGGVICATEDGAEIFTVAVEESARGKGIGAKIVEKLIEFCNSKKAKQIFLEVEDGNLSAIALYKKCGFSEVGRRKGFYRKNGEANDAIIMVKQI
jgi:ribosomal-protein-alanine N-acetyltransferase